MAKGPIIALVLRDERVEWTAVQRHKNRREITQQKIVELAWPEGVTDHRSPEAAAYLKTKIPPFKGSVGIAIPSDRVLLRILELPSIDSDELLGMAELQVDKFSPFPTDQMAIAIEILHQTEDASRVLIAAVQHTYIDQLGEFLMKTGVFPQAVDVDALGWWTLIQESGQTAGEGQELVVIYDDHCAQVLVVREGVPVLIRALDTSLRIHEEAFAQEVVDELNYTLTTLESSWGATATQLLTLWSRGPIPSAVTDGLTRTFPFAVKTCDLATLPPLSEGISRRLAAPGSASLDLAPATWRSAMLSGQLQRRAITTSIAALLLWGAAMGGAWYWADQQKIHLKQAQDELNRLQEDVIAVRELREQVAWLEAYADRTRSPLECLREIALLLPQGVDITSFTYAKATQLNLRGEADTDGPINDFIAQLEKSGLFTSVKTEGISTASRGGRNRSQFRITLALPGGASPETGT